MRMVDIIEKKKNGYSLTHDEIAFVVDGVVRETLPEYQTAAWLMAIWCKGLTVAETADLTQAMARSGEMVDLSAIPGIKVDKHSTGGVGDTTTLVLAPLVAACGVPVAKMSGRGLGHTGGTIDKLESIPGFRTAYSVPEFVQLVNTCGVAVVGQSANLVPADQKLYALRDTTATVDQVGLIASSIMSKKIASGCDALVLDVKVGSGAFMKTINEAQRLGEAMVSLGKAAGRKTVAVITDMSQPLGLAIGNALEVREAVEILQGEHAASRLHQVSLLLGAHMLRLAGKCTVVNEGEVMLQKAIDDGSGMDMFRRMVANQHGDAHVLDDMDSLCLTSKRMVTEAWQTGVLQQMDAEKLGRAASLLGAGRERKGDSIDPSVGFVLKVEIGQPIQKGQPLAEWYVQDDKHLEEAMQLFHQSLVIGESAQEVPRLVYQVID